AMVAQRSGRVFPILVGYARELWRSQTASPAGTWTPLRSAWYREGNLHPGVGRKPHGRDPAGRHHPLPPPAVHRGRDEFADGGALEERSRPGVVARAAELAEGHAGGVRAGRATRARGGRRPPPAPGRRLPKGPGGDRRLRAGRRTDLGR